jgi:nucleoside-diphosphate-sugar epimerase
VAKHVFIVGCGYVGRRVVAQEQVRGAAIVQALVRSEKGSDGLAALAIQPVPGDLDVPASLRRIETVGTDVYYFAPPPSHGVTDPRMRNVLGAICAALPRRIVYVSTTGVYGDCGGAWVTEERVLCPGSDRARRRCDAEEALCAFGAATGVDVVVLRVPAIYGPGRLPLERLRQGLPLLRPADSPWSNRIHVDDLVTACLAAMDRGRAGAVYNVADGNPTTLTDFFVRVADAVGLPRPPAIFRADAPAVLDAGMLTYLAESKRVDNSLLRQELGVTLRYPTLAEGLAASLAGDREPA